MAAKAKSKYQGKDGGFYIVNPKGCVHSATREHTAERLRLPGWRLATDEEIEAFKKAKVQRFDAPIAEPWSPLSEVGPEVPEGEAAS